MLDIETTYLGMARITTKSVDQVSFRLRLAPSPFHFYKNHTHL